MLHKKLSYILVSRNDEYCGDSVGRLTTTLNHLGETLARHGKTEQSEVVLVDWASPHKPLKDVLVLESSVKAIIKIVTVPKQIAAAYQRDSPFSEVHAMNTGFRHMSGRYFGRIDQDTLVGNRFIQWFYDEFEVVDYGFEWPKAAFSGRRNLDAAQSKRYRDYVFCNDTSKTVAICHPNFHFSRVTPSGKMMPFYGGAVGILLVEGGVYEAEKGFNERLVYMNSMDVEFMNRLAIRYPLYNLSLKLDADFYHLYHERADGASGDFTQPYVERDGARKTNSQSIRESVVPNDNDEYWGLIREDLEVADYV